MTTRKTVLPHPAPNCSQCPKRRELDDERDDNTRLRHLLAAEKIERERDRAALEEERLDWARRSADQEAAITYMTQVIDNGIRSGGPDYRRRAEELQRRQDSNRAAMCLYEWARRYWAPDLAPPYTADGTDAFIARRSLVWSLSR